MSWIAAKPVPDDVRMPIASIGYVGTLPRGEVRAPDYRSADPQAFSVHMSAESSPLRTHFHAVDQFQFVIGGAGRLGNHDIATGCVHYADRNTPYGPIAAGEEGVSYLTLRGVSSAGAFYMPESRDDLSTALGSDPGDRPAGARRNLSLVLDVEMRGGVSRWHDIHADPDGLRVAVGDVSADEPLAIAPVGGDGAYLVVLAGEVRAEDSSWVDKGSIHWCPAGFEGAIAAGRDGARVALLQLPVRPAA